MLFQVRMIAPERLLRDLYLQFFTSKIAALLMLIQKDAELHFLLLLGLERDIPK